MIGAQQPVPPRVDVVLVGQGSIPPWPLGQVTACATPVSARSLAAVFAAAAGSSADALLLWDPALGAPDPAVVEDLANATAEVHHAGLWLGQAGRPKVVDYIEPL